MKSYRIMVLMLMIPESLEHEWFWVESTPHSLFDDESELEPEEDPDEDEPDDELFFLPYESFIISSLISLSISIFLFLSLSFYYVSFGNSSLNDDEADPEED